MKRFFLSLCFAAFLTSGLVSCADEAADITPDSQLNVPEMVNASDNGGTVTKEAEKPED
jgi:hypothetical protein